MKKVLTAILILLVLAVAGWYGYDQLRDRGKTEPPKEEEISIRDEVVTVEITSNGAIPSTITVKKGTQVTFVNKDSSLHWIASDPHPSNDALPGFDSEEGLAEGDSFTFVFEQVGTFTYHDHLDALNTKFQGTVIVE